MAEEDSDYREDLLAKTASIWQFSLRAFLRVLLDLFKLLSNWSPLHVILS